MDDENTTDLQDQQTPDAPAADGVDHFEAGFGSAQGTTPDSATTETPPAQETPDSDPPADGEGQKTEAPAPAVAYAQIPQAEWETLKQQAGEALSLRQRLDQVFGKLGSVEHDVRTLRATGEPAELTDEDLKPLMAEFPELANLQRDAMNAALKRMRGAGAVDPKQVEEVVKARVADSLSAYQQETAGKVLAKHFPTWKEDVNTPEFAFWLNSQPIEVQVLAESDSVGDAARLVSAFHQFKKNPPAATPAAPSPSPASAPSLRQRQLAAAVTPKSSGGNTAGGDDPFESGFKGVQRQRR